MWVGYTVRPTKENHATDLWGAYFWSYGFLDGHGRLDDWCKIYSVDFLRQQWGIWISAASFHCFKDWTGRMGTCWEMDNSEACATYPHVWLFGQRILGIAHFNSTRANMCVFFLGNITFSNDQQCKYLWMVPGLIRCLIISAVKYMFF